MSGDRLQILDGVLWSSLPPESRPIESWPQRSPSGRSPGRRVVSPSQLHLPDREDDAGRRRPDKHPADPAAATDGTHTAVATAQVSAAAMVHVPGGAPGAAQTCGPAILKHVLGYLNTTELLLVARLVCKAWHECSKEPQRVDLGAWCRSELTMKAATNFRKVFDLSGTKYFDLSYAQDVEAASLPVLLCGTNPAWINLSCCEGLTDAHLSAMSPHCRRIIRLDLSFCGELSEAAVASLLQSSPALLELNLQGCEQVGGALCSAVAQHCGSLRSLNLYNCPKIQDADIAAVLRCCTNLRVINLSLCHALTDAALDSIAQCGVRLDKLSLAGNAAFSDVGLETVARSCTALRYLDLSWCALLTDGGLTRFAEHCRNLLAVRLFGCTLLSDDAVEELATHCRGLRALKMSGCPELTDRTLHTLGKHGQNITELFFSRCERLSEAGVMSIYKGCSRIQAIELFGCPKIRADYLRSMKSQDHFMHVDVWYDEAHGNSDDDDDVEGDREVPSARKGQLSRPD